MDTLRRLIFLTLLLMVQTTSPRAQEGALTSGARLAVADSVAALMERYYAAPDTGRLIAQRVREKARAGGYGSAETLPALAEALTVDLRALNRDKHLSVVYDPTHAAALSAPGERAEAEKAAAESAMAERARRSNYGFERVEILEGNVGLLEFGGPIHGSPEALAVAEQALRFLANTDAVILDLRGVPGGSATMMNFLISHFTEPGVPSLRVSWRPENRTEVRRTLAEVPGPRRPEVPLYVLVDRRSASAAEDLPFVLQNLDRATIVGETTAGAGRNNRYYPVGRGLAVSVSVSRVQDPETGREWEGTGVVPDVEAAFEDALAAAHLRALERLTSAEMDEDRRGVLADLRERMAAHYRPVEVSTATLRRYVGRYDGGMEVTLHDGALHLRPRPELPAFRLLPLAEARFFLSAGEQRVEFLEDADGRMRLELRRGGRASKVLSRMD